MSIQQQESNIDKLVTQLCSRARLAAKQASALTGEDKQTLLHNIARALEANKTGILAANERDVRLARNNKQPEHLIDRLALDEDRIDQLANSVRKVAALPDIIADMSNFKLQDSGIYVGTMRVPIGVIAIIYEARPGVTIDCSVLNLKAGNATILRGGREAWHSNNTLLDIVRSQLDKFGIDPNCVQAPPSAEHELIRRLISDPSNIDLIIPRGGRKLIESVLEHSKVPVLKHLDGNCHVYIDDQADLYQARAIIINAKTRRYGVCNALESLLVHADIAETLLKALLPELELYKVEVRGCQRTCNLFEDVVRASEEDFYTEYLAPILSVKIVNDVHEAIDHINHYGSHHSDCIVTESYSNGQKFIRMVDSSSVLWNASTAFADGEQYGLGAEIGISTDKLHARGPVGLKGLTSEKYVVYGNGETRK